MAENFDDGVRRLLLAARREASSRGASEIASEHLFLGLLTERTTLVAAFLTELGLDPPTLLKKVEASTSRKGRAARDTDLPLSQLSKAILEHGGREALEFGSEVMRPEHLLLGFMYNPNAPIGRIFAAENIRVDRARSVLRSVITRPPDTLLVKPAPPSKSTGGRKGNDFTIIWDPAIMDPADYARLVAALGDLARASGGVGVQRVGSTGVLINEVVGVRC